MNREMFDSSTMPDLVPIAFAAIAEQVTQTLRKGQKKSFGRQSMK
jgi:hypothetical protein